jgi:uncharacterized membrane protein
MRSTLRRCASFPLSRSYRWWALQASFRRLWYQNIWGMKQEHSINFPSLHVCESEHSTTYYSGPEVQYTNTSRNTQNTSRSRQTQIQIHMHKTQIEVHKTQIEIHEHKQKYTNTSRSTQTQVEIHEHNKLIMISLKNLPSNIISVVRKKYGRSRY